LSEIGSGAGGRGSDSLPAGILSRLPQIPLSVVRLFFMSTIIILPLTLFFALFSREVRDALLHELKRIIPIAFWMFTLFYLLRRLDLTNNQSPFFSRQTGSLGPPAWISAPAALLSFLIGTILIGLSVAAAWYIWRRGRTDKLNLIGKEMRSAIGQLEAGADFKNTIIRCYYRMCRLLSEREHLERAKAVTAREFAARLKEAGIGGSELQRLTTLFEAVRYGAQPFGEKEEREAIACLNAVAKTAEARGRASSRTPMLLAQRD